MPETSQEESKWTANDLVLGRFGTEVAAGGRCVPAAAVGDPSSLATESAKAKASSDGARSSAAAICWAIAGTDTSSSRCCLSPYCVLDSIILDWWSAAARIDDPERVHVWFVVVIILFFILFFWEFEDIRDG